jgi:general secretion pathway protein D
MRIMLVLSFYFMSIGMLCTLYGREESVPFSFEKRPLRDIVDFLAATKNINIMPPQRAADAEAFAKQTVTFKPHGKTQVPLKEAWSLLTLFLELSGFSLVPKKPQLYAIIRKGKTDEADVSRETLPLFVDVPFSKLPHSEQRIRYIYYFRNITVPTPKEQATHPLSKLFQALLSQGAPVIFEPKTNSVIIVDRADVIASLDHLISLMDATGFRETIEIVPLYNVPAQDVFNVFEALKKAASPAAEEVPFFSRTTSKQDISQFVVDTKVVPDSRTNSLVLMGRENNVLRISEFINDYIDVAPESGKSLLHVYDLQFLDAQIFAPQLQNIVSYAPQASQATQGPPSGSEQFFQGVQVIAENFVEVQTQFRTETVTLDIKADEIKGIEGQIRTGGNRLIIVAVERDWLVIKEFLQKIDIPQRQVILEALLVDFTYDLTTQLRSTVRSKTKSALLSQGVQFLASHITDVNRVLGTTPVQLAQDLLAVVSPPGAGVPPTLDRGSVIVSFNDPVTPGIFGLIQALKRVLSTKVSSYPHLMISNNQKGTLESQIIKRFQGELVTATDGSFTVPIDDVTATFTVTMVPHVASDDRVRIDVGLAVVDFTGVQLTRLTRELHTTATLSPGQILAMGGLTRIDERDFSTLTPLLARIPLIGFLFRGDNYETVKTVITLFISPTIIQPRRNLAGATVTKDKLCSVMKDTSDSQVGSPRDPITHIFFRRQESHQFIKRYISDTDTITPAEIAMPLTKRQAGSVRFHKLKELAATEDTSFLTIKQPKCKSILNP